MPQTPRASVLLPTFQAIEFLERVLTALAAQRADFAWDLHVIDSGSRDGTLECLARAAARFPVPVRVETIPPAAFDHGDTRNLLAARTSAELLVFLTQDAIPSRPDWLATLARNFADARVGAAYCRNVPRADCWPLTRAFSLDDPGYATRRAEVRMPSWREYQTLDADARRALLNFNNVASAIRRELWERHPFPRTMMGEDVLIGRAILEAGYAIVYDADATVDHSHDYAPPKWRWRGEVDARFNAEWLDRKCVDVPHDVPVLTERMVGATMAALERLGHTSDERAALEPRARELRRAYVDGLYTGSQTPRRYARTSLRANGKLRVVLALPAFARPAVDGVGAASDTAVRESRLPDAMRHELELARELQRRGHHVTVLALDAPRRSDRAGDAPFRAEPADAQELRALRVRARDDADARAGFASLLDELAPDVLIASITSVARVATPAHDERGVEFRSTAAADSHEPRGTWLALARVAWQRELPWLVRWRDDTAELEPDGAFAPLVAAADLCMVPSAALHKRVVAALAHAPYEARRVVPCLEGVDCEPQHARAKTRERRVRFGYFGAPIAEPTRALAPELARLVALARAWEPREAVLRVHVADAELAPDACAELEHAPNVELVRGYENADVAELLADVDVVLALADGFAAFDRSAQLALLHRTPVIASAGHGHDELVRDGIDGLVVPARDERALGAALRRCIDERALLDALRPAARAGCTIGDEAAELEFRCRGAACLERRNSLDSTVLLDVTGNAAVAQGTTIVQAGGALLLEPGARATLTLRDVPLGPVEIEVRQLDIGSEPGVILGGAVATDGLFVRQLRLARPLPKRPRYPRPARWLANARRALGLVRHPPDRVIDERVRAWATQPTLELAFAAGDRHMRITRVLVRSFAPSASEAARAATRSGNPQLDRALELRVEPGAPLAESELPTLAVVIPSFEGRDVLDACLASLREARYPRDRLRVLVVDNGSRDGTVEHVRKHHAGVELVALERNLGFAAACNAGARAAAGARVLVFVNNDMRVDPAFLVELASPLARSECAASVALRLGWDGATLDGAGVGATFAGIALQPGYGALPGPEHAIARRTLFPCGGAMAIDAAIFADVGGFDEAFFAYYEDLDLGWRMWLMGHATHYVPSAIAYHHHSHTSRRFEPALVRRVMIRNSLLCCVKNYDDAHLARVLPVVLALATRRAVLAARIDKDALRIERAGARDLAPSGKRASDDGTCAIRALGAADLAALDDLLGDFENWMQRRRAVQARRVRADREILPLFLDPLACVEGDPAYQALQRELVELYRLREVFEPRG